MNDERAPYDFTEKDLSRENVIVKNTIERILRVLDKEYTLDEILGPMQEDDSKWYYRVRVVSAENPNDMDRDFAFYVNADGEV